MNDNHAFLKKLIESIVKEIVQADITPDERGGGIQANDNTTGIYGKDKSPGSYFKKSENFPYLWHLKGGELKSKGKGDNENISQGAETIKAPDTHEPETPDVIDASNNKEQNPKDTISSKDKIQK